LVTNHDAFGYFADRYEFDLLGTVIPGGSTLAAPSSADLAALVDVMKSEEVTVIFAETSSSTTLAEAVTAELGSDVDVVELYTESLGEVGSDADTYIGMLRVNATRIAHHLS
jgi:zinc/manganese transport system substrate-binding protein